MIPETWLAGLAGGALIGAAAVLLMALLGRIAGVSGIVGGLLPPEPAADFGWRLTFILGLIAGPVLYSAVAGRPGVGAQVADLPVLVAAGLLVGVGTTLGSGCTSGHGVCGLARLSPRSLVATGTFMATAIVTVLLVRHVL